MLGLEKNHEPGAIGSGSVGHGRIWRYMHSETRYASMQRESIDIFKEVEKKTGNKILLGGGLLYMKPQGHKDIEEFLKYKGT